MSFTRNLFLALLIISFFSSCFGPSDEEKMAKVEAECSKRNSIDGLYLRFLGYFPSDADTIKVIIKSMNNKIDSFVDVIPHRVTDSIRHLREYTINRNILLTDTLFLKIDCEPVKKVYDFKYRVRAQFAMFDHNWGCSLCSLTVDGKPEQSGYVSFMKTSFNFVDRSSFKLYYSTN
jgi:hypothetical protein